METSISINIIMQLAANEAIAGEFKEIQPEHLLAAILKVSELSIDNIKDIASGEAGALALASEINGLRSKLSINSINSKHIRCQLRTQLGRGQNPYKSGTIHRSQASRQMFDLAAKSVDENEQGIFNTTHLLEAILQNPTLSIERVLGEDGAAEGKKQSQTPLLDKYGKILIKTKNAGKAGAESNRQVECKALIRALAQKNNPAVMIVSDSEDVVIEVVTATAVAINNKTFEQQLEQYNVIDVTAIKPGNSTGQVALEQLDQLTSEAIESGNVILFLPSLEINDDFEEMIAWKDQLKSTLSKQVLPCICRITPDTYRLWIEKDFDWKQLVQVMWMHDQSKNEIPWKL